jgi:dipeptidyl aminopeptidase/acylaminoacyl peptidase
MSLRSLRGLVWIPLVVAAMVSAQETKRPMTVDDALDMVQVSSPVISPDGKWVLYSRSELKWKDNKRESRFYMIPASGGEAFQFLSGENDSSPAWSPDSKSIAFLSNRGAAGAEGGGRQVYLIRADGGEAVKLTEHKDGLNSFRWSEDGKSLFFVANEIKSQDQKTAEKAGEDVVAVDEGPNGQGRGQWNELWIFDLASKKERQVSKDKMIVGSYDPSPDGTKIAITFRTEDARNAGNLSEVAVVDVSTGAMTRLTNNRAPESQPRWSPDGKLLAFGAPGISEWELRNAKLWILDVASRQIRLASGTYEGGVSGFDWLPDQKSILLEGSNGAFRNVYRLDVASGQVAQVTKEKGVMSVGSYSHDFAWGAGTYSDPATPGDIWLVDLRSGQKKQLTHANPQMAQLSLSRAELVKWKSKDGLEIEGILNYPVNYQEGTKVPLMLNVHGGPAGVFSYGFSPIYHIYAGLGFASLSPNVRGSSGYNDALLRGNMQDIGGGDYQDLVTGVDMLVARGIVDPDKMGIKGWSYGGILGGWTITQTNRFKAASLGAMVTDWSSEYAMGFNHDVRLWYIGGTPWDNPSRYREQSSYTHIKNVLTPTILFHGENDTTDTIGQSMMFYVGLKDRNVPVKFLRFPREPHGFREPHHSRIRDTEEIAWMQKYVLGKEWKAPVRPEDQKKAGTDRAPH